MIVRSAWLLCFFLSCSALAGTINGTVQENRGPAVSGVTVYAEDSFGNFYQAITDSKGFYEFVGLKAGDYVVTLESAYLPLITTPAQGFHLLSLGAHMTVTLDFGISPSTGVVVDFGQPPVGPQGDEDKWSIGPYEVITSWLAPGEFQLDFRVSGDACSNVSEGWDLDLSWFAWDGSTPVLVKATKIVLLGSNQGTIYTSGYNYASNTSNFSMSPSQSTSFSQGSIARINFQIIDPYLNFGGDVNANLLLRYTAEPTATLNGSSVQLCAPPIPRTWRGLVKWEASSSGGSGGQN